MSLDRRRLSLSKLQPPLPSTSSGDGWVRGNMDDDMFEELLESVREGGAILRGEKEASRIFVVELSDDVERTTQYEIGE